MKCVVTEVKSDDDENNNSDENELTSTSYEVTFWR
jgi:hypothetical protein